jgi:DNA repair photolyase
MMALPPLRGRGSSTNPKNRFESTERVFEPPDNEDEISAPLTQFFPDLSKTIIAYNDSPDVGFDASINPYRGCEHGCVYCYARPTHEYLGFSSGLDFETKIMVKEDAPELLRKELSSRSWKPQLIALSGNTDCYQPVEKQKQLTRRCLEVLLEVRNPVVIITKNYLVTRDIDVLRELARYDCVGVTLSLTSLDPRLSSLLEPRASRPARRLAAI